MTNIDLRDALKHAASALNALRMRVLSPTQVITEKLGLRADTAENDFAVAFLVLTDRLGISC
jgi:hypothetical protein